MFAKTFLGLVAFMVLGRFFANRVENQRARTAIAFMLFAMIVLIISNCASTGREYVHTYRYTGEYQHYSVVALERVVLVLGREYCEERVITLKARAGLNPYYVVQHVRAVDRDCNDRVDEVRFRNAQDHMKLGFRLRTDIINAFHVVKPL